MKIDRKRWLAAVILIAALAFTGCAKPQEGSAETPADAPENVQEETSEASPEITETVLDDGRILSNDSSDFVLISDEVPDAILEIRYYSTYNFVGDRIRGYEQPTALMTREEEPYPSTYFRFPVSEESVLRNEEVPGDTEEELPDAA